MKGMKIVFSEKAERDLEDADATLRKLFFQHAEKVAQMPPRRHLKFGVPYPVEEVTRQARLVYRFENDACQILHCFKTHKEYERWYNSYK